MKILSIDTATEACSAALLLDGKLLTRYAEPGRGHAELILPMVDELLSEAGLKLKQLDGIAVGRGPGAFTGVRIAVSVAQGLAYGAGLKVVPVSDLTALAQRAADKYGVPAVLVCIDARMNEVYWAGFEVQPDGLVHLFTDESVGPPASVDLNWMDEWMGAGSGWATYPTMGSDRGPDAETGPIKVDGTLFPRAEEIARLAVADFESGNALPPDQVLPVYLRDRVAFPKR